MSNQINEKVQVTRTALFDIHNTDHTTKTDFKIWSEYRDFLKRHPDIELLSINILKSGSIIITYLKYTIIK